ncbi:MAG: type II secretion system F family protein [Bacilli bacterium]
MYKVFLRKNISKSYKRRKNEKIKYNLAKLLINIPLIGRYIVLSNLIIISSNISLLFDTTKDKLEVLKLTKNQVGNKVYKEIIQVIYINAFSGKSLLNELNNEKYIPLFFKQMFEIGEQTGQLPNLMKKTSNYYESKLNGSIKKMKSLIEPIFILLIVILLLPVLYYQYLVYMSNFRKEFL